MVGIWRLFCNFLSALTFNSVRKNISYKTLSLSNNLYIVSNTVMDDNYVRVYTVIYKSNNFQITILFMYIIYLVFD